MKLHGGLLESAKVDNLYLTNTRHLFLKDMPGFELDTVLMQIPELVTLKIENVPSFKKETFSAMVGKMLTYKGLETLGLELLTFDLESVKEDLFQILRHHSATLRTLLLGKNKISATFFQEMASQIKEFTMIETIQLTHVVKSNEVDWVECIKTLGHMVENRPQFPIKIILSDYQTR